MLLMLLKMLELLPAFTLCRGPLGRLALTCTDWRLVTKLSRKMSLR